MLVLKTKIGEVVTFIDKDSGKELGRMTRLKPNPHFQHDVLFGFDFLPEIQILRNSLVVGKDSQNGKKTQQKQ